MEGQCVQNAGVVRAAVANHVLCSNRGQSELIRMIRARSLIGQITNQSG
jgi:hypothetical protein